MALSILSLGRFEALQAMSTVLSRGFMTGSPPPAFAATMISLTSFENILPRLASIAPFLRLMVLHLECPDMCCCAFLLRAGSGHFVVCG